MPLVPPTTNTNLLPSVVTQNSPVTAGSSSNHPQTDPLSSINQHNPDYPDAGTFDSIVTPTLAVHRAYARSHLKSIKPIVGEIPSLWRKDHPIPQDAVPIKILGGRNKEAIEELVHLASKSKHTCFSNFNGQLIIARPNANTEELKQDLQSRIDMQIKLASSGLIPFPKTALGEMYGKAQEFLANQS